MQNINFPAAIAAGVAGWLVGALWYSPVLFAGAWQRETGLTDERLQRSNMALIFGVSLLLSLVAAVVFALFLIDGGYHTVQFTVIGLVLGLWH